MATCTSSNQGATLEKSLNGQKMRQPEASLYETAMSSGDCISALTEPSAHLPRAPSQANFTANPTLCLFHPSSIASLAIQSPIHHALFRVEPRLCPPSSMLQESVISSIHLHERNQYNSSPRCHGKYLFTFPHRCNLDITVFNRVLVHPHQTPSCSLQYDAQLSRPDLTDGIIKRHKYNHLFIYLKNAIHTIFSTPRHVKFGNEIG